MGDPIEVRLGKSSHGVVKADPNAPGISVEELCIYSMTLPLFMGTVLWFAILWIVSTVSNLY